MGVCFFFFSFVSWEQSSRMPSYMESFIVFIAAFQGRMFYMTMRGKGIMHSLRGSEIVPPSKKVNQSSTRLCPRCDLNIPSNRRRVNPT